MTSPVLHLSGARFGYGSVPAVTADLRVDAGEVVALMGSNGSGKSTLVKGALGLIDSFGGEVEWFGQPLLRGRRRPVVGYVPQRQPSTSPIPSTLEELVRSGCLIHRRMISRYGSTDRRSVQDAIRLVGLEPQRRTPVRELSGGQQRRALVARALAGRASVLVLDEPFAGVDHENQDALAAVFHDLADRGVTMLVVVHELGVLDGIVTRVVHLADGAVIFDGDPRLRPQMLLETDRHDPHCGDVQTPVPSTLGLFTR